MPELDRFVATRIKSGRYENASEVMRAALRTLEREEREDRARLIALRTVIRDGEESGYADPGSFDRIRKQLNLGPRKK